VSNPAPASPQPPAGDEIRTVIVGTAGHIDHGKSSLVRALTGIDPDRLAEEQARGMTIDLGFAPYRHRSGATVGFIDVPGHERFVRNMVAGATSVDIALLVVAADDGVMPQTREHLAILELLGVRCGLVVLNKIDLVDDDLVEMAAADVADLVAGTFLEGAPLVRVSVADGSGLPALRATLDDLVAAVAPHGDDGPFRMPVQRVFSMAGHGLVLTGVPVSGRVQVGDQLEVVGSGMSLRVRGIQAYGVRRECARAGHSTALNVAGVEKDDVSRGDVLAVPQVFRAARFVALDFVAAPGARLRARHAVRVHAGTAETLGQAVVLDVEEPPETPSAVPVQLRLEAPLCVAPGDRALVRDAASMQLLGGGLVLAAGDGRLKRGKQRVLEALRQRRETLGDTLRLALAIVSAAGTRGCRLAELSREVGRPPSALRESLAQPLAEGEVHLQGEQLFGAEAVGQAADALVAELKLEHRQRPLMEWVDVGRLRTRLALPEPLLQAAVASDERLESASGGRLRRRGHRGRLTPELQAAREALLERLRLAGSCPPDSGPEQTGLDPRQHAALVEMLRESGEIVVIAGLLFHAEALARMKQQLVEHARRRQGAIVIPELRDELGTTRKYLIPLLEHFDALGLTARHGDQRVLRGGLGADGSPGAS